MDDVRGMDGREPGQRLAQQLGDEVGRQWPVVAHQGRDRAAADDRHGEQDAIVLTGPAQRGQHIGVVDAHRLLAHEPQQGPGIGLAEHLGGDEAVGFAVEGDPDRAHAALTDEVDEFVTAGEDLTHRSVRVRRRPQQSSESDIGRGVSERTQLLGSGDRSQLGRRSRRPRHRDGETGHRGLLVADGLESLGDLVSRHARGLTGELAERLEAVDDRRIADLDSLRGDELGHHRGRDLQHLREPRLGQPKSAHDASSGVGQGFPIERTLLLHVDLAVLHGAPLPWP